MIARADLLKEARRYVTGLNMHNAWEQELVTAMADDIRDLRRLLARVAEEVDFYRSRPTAPLCVSSATIIDVLDYLERSR